MARVKAVKEFRVFQKRFPRLGIVQQVALYNRSRSLLPTRTGRVPLAATLRADIRSLREGLLREPRSIDIYSFPAIRDLRDAWEELKKHRVTNAATPMDAERLAMCLREAPPSIGIVFLAMGCGALRHAEIGRESTYIKVNGRGKCYSICRVPKRGVELREASIPMTPTTMRIVEKVINDRGRIQVSPLKMVNTFIRKMAASHGWGMGRWSSYSIRHGALSAALGQGISMKDIIKQTAHQGKIPITYMRNANPLQAAQLLVANALLLPASRVPQPASVCSSVD